MRSLLLLAVALVPSFGQQPFYTLVGDAAGDRFGYTLGRLGDVDGDGVPDFVTSAATSDVNGIDSGRAYVISGADGSRIHSFDGDSAGDFFGFVANSAGDVDGDGVPDVIVGAPFDDDAAPDAGRVSLFSGATGALLYTVDGFATGDNFGYSAMGLDDVDGDGFSDFAVGARNSGLGAPTAGSVFVFSGQTGGLLWSAHGDFSGDLLGWDLTAMDDLDGDGVQDVVVGAPQLNVLGVGYVRVYSGATGAGLTTFVGDAPHDDFGISLRFAGDLNGDGTPDMVVGAIQYDFSTSLPTGGGYIRAISGANGAVLFTRYGDALNDWMGIAVSSAGDVNGDGFDDFLGGACQTFQVPAAPGYARIYSGLDGGVLHEFGGQNPGDVFGRKATPAGDLNGDGFGDVVICARKADNNGSSSGVIRIFHLGPQAGPVLDGACAEGNVGFGAGGPFPVLKVNGEDGWVSRRVDAAIGAPLTISVETPPTHSLPFAPYILYGRLGAASPTDATEIAPFGTLCLPPCTLFPGNPALFTLASSLPGLSCVLFVPTAATPITLATPPITFPLTMTLQAFVEEDASLIRVANGLVVRVR